MFQGAERNHALLIYSAKENKYKIQDLETHIGVSGTKGIHVDQAESYWCSNEYDVIGVCTSHPTNNNVSSLRLSSCLLKLSNACIIELLNDYGDRLRYLVETKSYYQ